MAEETRTVRMKEHHTPTRGPRKGKTLFAARTYELDPETAREVVEAKAGGYSQAEPDVPAAQATKAAAKEQKK